MMLAMTTMPRTIVRCPQVARKVPTPRAKDEARLEAILRERAQVLHGRANPGWW